MRTAILAMVLTSIRRGREFIRATENRLRLAPNLLTPMMFRGRIKRKTRCSPDAARIHTILRGSS